MHRKTSDTMYITSIGPMRPGERAKNRSIGPLSLWFSEGGREMEKEMQQLTMNQKALSVLSIAEKLQYRKK